MKPKIGIIIGSNRPTRVCRIIADWARDGMSRDDLEIDLIDLAEINLPFLDEPAIPARHLYTKDHTKAWSNKISSYDGFVLLFPQYNWGYPAVIKNALDFLYDEWANKPVSIMCYGSHGGFQGAMAMNLVTKGLKMKSMSSNVPLDIEDSMLDDQGQFIDIDEAFAGYAESLKSLATEFSNLLN
jgi:NAD(P)H-dependent FMN reductase